MKRIAILGSTGSIGKSSLRVAQHLGPDCVQVVSLAARNNIDLLERQAIEYSPRLIGVYDVAKAAELQRRLPHIPVVPGMEGILAAATLPEADSVISAMCGSLAIEPTVAAIQAGKALGLANKEALISAGALVSSLAKQNGVPIIPIDSEHSAIYQCLRGEDRSAIHRLILTASGGPFRSMALQELQEVTVDHALRHPTWNMGPKITVDCSTLMNKGLEVIEAHWLFGVPIEKIEVVIHPQSIIHSMVEFVDQSTLAQMSEPNMIVPIQYFMTYPHRQAGIHKFFDFTRHREMQFYPPDFDKFRCLRLAYDALRCGGSLPGYMNAANEVLVDRFLNNQIRWIDIPTKLEDLMLRHSVAPVATLEDILAVDRLAREEAGIK